MSAHAIDRRQPKTGRRVARETAVSQRKDTYLSPDGAADRGPSPTLPLVGEGREGRHLELAMDVKPNGSLREALTLDDVLFRPGPSDVMPAEADIRSRIPSESS